MLKKALCLNKRQRTIAETRINDVLFELEMSVGNESIDRHIKPFQNIQPFQIQNNNPYPNDERTLQYSKWYFNLILQNGKFTNTRNYRVLHGFF